LRKLTLSNGKWGSNFNLKNIKKD
jgi:Ran GTPase-activating protein (RanGAP) involved in mRNA processing and transport